MKRETRHFTYREAAWRFAETLTRGQKPFVGHEMAPLYCERLTRDDVGRLTGYWVTWDEES